MDGPDGLRLLDDIRTLCDFGPRPAGSAASALQRDRLSRHFRDFGAAVVEQPFHTDHPMEDSLVSMANLVASWNPKARRRVLVGAHGDTRPTPDRERTAARRALPFIGANDGASGLAILLEVARFAPGFEFDDVGLDLVVFDGEELVFGQRGEYCLGSQEFARRHDAERTSDPVNSPVHDAAIVVDMVGRIGLAIDQEQHSLYYARPIVAEVWAAARRCGAAVFRSRVGRAVIDDHLPLLEVGIPAALVIDLEDPRWHTADDLPEFCSAENLRQVAAATIDWVRHRLIEEKPAQPHRPF